MTVFMCMCAMYVYKCMFAVTRMYLCMLMFVSTSAYASVSVSVYPTAEFYVTELLSWRKSGKYRNELPYELSLLSLLIYSCTAVTYPSLHIRKCLETLYY